MTQKNNEIKNEASEPKTKFHAFKYWADVIKWFINLIGNIFDYIKANPFPKKDDFTN